MILDKVGPCWRIGALALACTASAACSGSPVLTGPGSASLRVVASISPIASLVAAVGGSKIQLATLVPLGVSPETYDPRPKDLVTLSRARLLVENGAGLETWLDKLIANAAKNDLHVLVLSDGLPVADRDPHAPAGMSGNPHLWLDPVFAQAYVRKIAAELERLDPPNRAYYARNERTEVRRLRALDAWIRAQLSKVPPDRRTAIVFHDAWYYFDRRYGIRDVGAVELTPGQEPSAEYFAKLISLARSRHVRAAFAEPQFSPKLIRQLAESADIHTVSDLYDDTLGDAPGIDTYEGMLRYDVANMVRAMNR